MSLYYNQEFVSPTRVYAEIKELLRSYFSAGLIDDVLFPLWTEQCLKRFRKNAFKIVSTVIEMKDHRGCLPNDFEAVREAWMCTIFNSDPIADPSAIYYQEDCVINPFQYDKCDTCFQTETCNTKFQVTRKVTGTHIFSFERKFLLKPGNIEGRNGREVPHGSGPHSYDIEDGYIRTHFREGHINLLYYADPSSGGEQMIPDDFWVEDYIRKHIIYKCFVQLSHVVTDETFNQIQLKKQEAEREQAEAFILAETELKKQTSEEKIRQIGISYHRNDKFRIPERYFYGRGRHR